ncbi:MAG: hypothetical protein ACE5GS_08080 [Kiloniellaceae bacterium]
MSTLSNGQATAGLAGALGGAMSAWPPEGPGDPALANGRRRQGTVIEANRRMDPQRWNMPGRTAGPAALLEAEGARAGIAAKAGEAARKLHTNLRTLRA